MPNLTAWKTDNYKFVGKAFDYELKNGKSKALFSLVGEETTNNIDYELTGRGDFGELQKYDGSLKTLTPRRGFKKIITPEEYIGTYDIHRKQWRNDKFGETKRAGSHLAIAANKTTYLYLLRMFANAFSSNQLGGDGKSWAATDHPVASKMDEGRSYVADSDAGTFSNLITSQLSTKAIDDARILASRYETPAGMPYLGEYNTLLVSPELEPMAKKLLGVNSRIRPTKDPDSAENAASSISDMDGYIVVGGGKEGFSSKQWAICDRTMLAKTALIVYNEKPTVMDGNNSNPLVQTWVAYADFDMGFGDARPIVFSNPA